MEGHGGGKEVLVLVFLLGWYCLLSSLCRPVPTLMAVHIIQMLPTSHLNQFGRVCCDPSKGNFPEAHGLGSNTVADAGGATAEGRVPPLSSRSDSKSFPSFLFSFYWSLADIQCYIVSGVQCSEWKFYT